MRAAGESLRILRVLAYRRVSTREQGIAGTSLDAQSTEISRYCSAHSLPNPIDHVEVESGGEESEEKRVEVMRLLAGVRAGDAVIVSKIDRFARDMVFIVKHVRAIRKRGACFISIAEAFDSRRPESEMMLGAWAMAADMERRRIQERTQGPRKLLRAQGKYVEGGVPFGYRRAVDGSRRLIIEPKEAEIVKEMFQQSANGWSTVRISKDLRKRYPGERCAFSFTWVSHALHNPIYTGKVSRTAVRPNGHTRSAPLPGEWVDAHEPIVSSDLFAIAQRGLATRLSGRKPASESSTASFLMRGVARCSFCKGAIGCIPRRGRHKSGYYVCNRRLTSSKYDSNCPDAPYLRQDTVDESMAREVGVFLKSIKKALGRPPAQIKKPDFEKRRADVHRKRDNVLKLVAEGLVTFDAAANTLREIENELASVDAAAAEFNAALTQDTSENRRGALTFIEQVSDEWEALTIDVRRSVLSTLAREIGVGKDKHPRIVWKDAGEIAVDYAIGALPVLRAPVVKALPAPRMKVADLLETAQGRTASRTRKAS